MPDGDLVAAMRAECSNVNLQAEHRVFVDYWIAQPGQRGVKTDWPATWRNWMRRVEKETKGSGRSRAPSRGQQRDAELLDFMTEQDHTITRLEITP